jgi:hypothetical protein
MGNTCLPDPNNMSLTCLSELRRQPSPKCMDLTVNQVQSKVSRACFPDLSNVGLVCFLDPSCLDLVSAKSKVRGPEGYLALAKSMFARLTLLNSGIFVKPK